MGPARSSVRRRRAALALTIAVVAALAAGVVAGAGHDRDGDGGAAAGGEPAASTTAGGSPAASTIAGRDAGSPAPATRTPAAERRATTAGLTLEQQVGTLLIASFNGTRAPGYIRERLRQRRLAGVILFRGNAPSAASVRALAASLQRAAGGDAIVSLDQEGGEIRILSFAGPAPAQSQLATPAAAGASAGAAARELRRLGVNVTLGPVADVALRPDSVMRERAFPGGGARVAAFVAAAVRADRRAGVEPVLKHFPGLGGATGNTDFGATTVDRSRSALAEDLRPFRARGARIVMVGHARYPALDPGHIASQSRAIIMGVLRRELGFRGVVMTDSLEAKAVTEDSSVETAAVRSIAAGADLLLLTGPGSLGRVRGALLDRARHSQMFRARVREAAGRVLILRRELRRVALAHR